MEPGHISAGCAPVTRGLPSILSSDSSHHVAWRVSSSTLHMALSTNQNYRSGLPVQSQPPPPSRQQ